MTNGEPGRIFWSARAGRFYQEGRRGAVGIGQAAESLRWDEAASRWRDQRGRFVSEGAFSAPEQRILRFARRDEQGRPFISITQTDRAVIRAGLERFRPASNQQAVVRIVVRTPDGRAFVFSASSRMGEAVDLEFLEQQARRNARGGLSRQGVEMTTHAVGQATITRDYIIRTFST